MSSIKAKSAEAAWGEIVDEANAAALQSVRIVKELPVGKWGRQGDIYLVAVEPTHPRGEETKNRQLAVGETQGSRHVIAGAGFTLYAGTHLPPGWNQWNGAALVGPVIVARRRFKVTHPEHAHVSLPEGCYQVVHQLDAQTQRRVQD